MALREFGEWFVNLHPALELIVSLISLVVILEVIWWSGIISLYWLNKIRKGKSSGPAE